MADYLDSKAVRLIGEPVGTEDPFDVPVIPPNKLLIVVCATLQYEMASDRTHPGDLEEWLESYEAGSWANFQYYLLDESNIHLCPDRGRQPL